MPERRDRIKPGIDGDYHRNQHACAVRKSSPNLTGDTNFKGFATDRLRDDNPSRVDLLGFADIVAAVESTITRDELLPVTVGVNAPWGGGKTTVLHLLQEKLQQREDVIVVSVSPWEYDRTTDAKASLIGAVLDRIAERAESDKTVGDAVIARVAELRKRINVAKAIRLAATSALTMTLPNLTALASIFDSGAESENPTLEGFRAQFGALLSEESLKDINHVVVLVDDLDRSLPDMVVETLEAIKLFLSVDRMAFVIAADEENVARAIGLKLESTGQPTTAHQYLEKIVQIPFRIPALSRELTEEYLALLMIDSEDDLENLVQQVRDSRENRSTLAARFDGLIAEDSKPDVQLAERLAPILHHHTQGNPRRLKRFLNAMWVRIAFAGMRGVDLEADACAKLMVAELLYPEFFSQMIGWLASGTLEENVGDIENGEGDYPQQIFEWGRLDPSLANSKLTDYALLAASLRGDTVEEAALPSQLRALADALTNDSAIVRNRALSEASELETEARSLLARHVAHQLRLQRVVERQQALAESLSGLANEPSIAMTAAEELAMMDPAMVQTPVPIALLAKNQPAEFKEFVSSLSTDTSVQERTRLAAFEALKAAD